MMICGVDPGTVVTGYGLLSVQNGGVEVIDYGCIRPPSQWKLSDRYLAIYEGLLSLLDRFQPQAMAVETQFVRHNPQSALKLGMARGCAILAARKSGAAVFEYPPSRPKKAVVGHGQASKYQVQAMLKVLLNLKDLPPEDAADALALAFCHAHNRSTKEF
ncbi:MAG: crossover junction endodeoxyribonuclease RuvC [Chlamydiia bacterium]|nr:crossover junction endodeoxyribonuclease RuvC [Chlamydiia bacterium]